MQRDKLSTVHNMEIKEADIAWLAGIIDGEGNIHMGKHLGGNKGKRYLDIKVRVSNTDMRMIKKISEIYVGWESTHGSGDFT